MPFQSSSKHRENGTGKSHNKFESLRLLLLHGKQELSGKGICEQRVKGDVASKDKVTLLVLWKLLNQTGCGRLRNDSVIIRLHPGFRKKWIIVFGKTHQNCACYLLSTCSWAASVQEGWSVVPGAHFSSLNADLMQPPRPSLDPQGTKQGSPASGLQCVQCVYVHRHPWGR